jgi:YggT family protein
MNVWAVLQIFVEIMYGLLIVCLFARIILSWFPHKKTWISDFLKDVSDPILKPFQKIIPTTMGIDFSPILAYFFLRLTYVGVMIGINYLSTVF